MDKEELERIWWRQLLQASADQLSCVKRRRIARRVVIIFAEYGLRFIAFKPLGERDCALGVGGILENGRIIYKRDGPIGLAANIYAYIRKMRVTLSPAQLYFS